MHLPQQGIKISCSPCTMCSAHLTYICDPEIRVQRSSEFQGCMSRVSHLHFLPQVVFSHSHLQRQSAKVQIAAVHYGRP